MQPDFHTRRAAGPTAGGRALAGLAAVLCAFLAGPAVAGAATDRWVDTETGSNAGNDCMERTRPCATITNATQSSLFTGTAGTIHVDDGTYAENVQVARTNRLVADDFVPGDSGPTTIVGSTRALWAKESAEVSGFVITSPTLTNVAVVDDDATLSGNTVVAQGHSSAAIAVHSSSGSPTVTGNTVLADSGDEGVGVRVEGGGADATITSNRVGTPDSGFDIGIEVGPNDSASVTGNTIRGLNQLSGSNANGIRLRNPAGATVSGNRIDSPLQDPGEEANGVFVSGLEAGRSVSLDHNEIVGVTGIGVAFVDIRGDVSMEGDVIARTLDRAIFAGTVEELTITGLTVVDSGWVEVGNSRLTIDSSIFDSPFVASNGATCEITYSRGPAIVEGGDGCGEFQTTADPSFVDRHAPIPDLHLRPDSPLIDAGNPAPPAAATVDMDGDRRALEGDGECPLDAERDMGADEVVVAIPNCPVDPDPDPDPDLEDRTAPETAIDGKRRQRGRRARFSLRSSEDGTFECRLDRGRFIPCPSAYRTPRMTPGKHRLTVRAIDAAGNADPTPSVKRFQLKRRHLR